MKYMFFLSAESHIKQRIGTSLLIPFCSFIDGKSHEFIELFRGGILFVDAYFANAEAVDTVLHQAASRAFSHLLRSEKQHFQFALADSHKSH